MVLLAILLWASVWLVRNAPKAVQGAVIAETSHEPDYFANNFTWESDGAGGITPVIKNNTRYYYGDGTDRAGTAAAYCQALDKMVRTATYQDDKTEKLRSETFYAAENRSKVICRTRVFRVKLERTLESCN